LIDDDNCWASTTSTLHLIVDDRRRSRCRICDHGIVLRLLIRHHLPSPPDFIVTALAGR